MLCCPCWHRQIDVWYVGLLTTNLGYYIFRYSKSNNKCSNARCKTHYHCYMRTSLCLLCLCPLFSFHGVGRRRSRGQPKESWRRSEEKEIKESGWTWGQVQHWAARRGLSKVSVELATLLPDSYLNSAQFSLSALPPSVGFGFGSRNSSWQNTRHFAAAVTMCGMNILCNSTSKKGLLQHNRKYVI